MVCSKNDATETILKGRLKGALASRRVPVYIYSLRPVGSAYTNPADNFAYYGSITPDLNQGHHKIK
jgi:hypothetical protein